MSTLHDVERLLARLSRPEKAQLLQWIADDLGGSFPGIAHDEAVLGGDAHIVRTRIPVWLLVQARRLGASEASLLNSYPVLRAEDLANAWAYARAHADEIEQAIATHEMA